MIATLVTFCCMMSYRGRRLQLPTIRLYAPGRLSHPARLFATPCNSGSDFVFPVQTQIFVQGLQRLQRPRWAKKRQEEESSETRTYSLSPSSNHSNNCRLENRLAHVRLAPSVSSPPWHASNLPRYHATLACRRGQDPWVPGYRVDACAGR